MSHFTTIKTVIRDIDALAAAVSELGLRISKNSSARGYSGNTIPGEFVIHLPGPYDIAVTRDSGAYQLTSDLFMGHVEQSVGAGYSKLLQLYAVHKAAMEARRKGLSVHRRLKEDGSIQLTIQHV